MPLTVFLAEDQRDALESLTELLTAQAIAVAGSATSEMEAAAWLAEHSQACDVLITDLLLLPGGSGFGIVSQAKAVGAFKNIVVSSDFVTPAVAETCKKLGADAVFTKGDLDQLLVHLRSLRDGV